MSARAMTASLAACAALWALAPATALAQDSEAQLRYERGVALYEQQRYPEALEHFLASFRLAPTANMAFNIAQVCGLMSRWVEAYNWYETHLTQFELDDAARGRAQSARDALLDRVAVVEVATTPPGAELFVDRADLGAVGRSPRRVAVAPGSHRVLARAAGHHEASAAVEAAQGQVVAVDVALTAVVGRLVVESTPPGAEVRAEGRGEPLGTTPLELELSPGSLRLAISLDGYEQAIRDVTVSAAQEARVAVRLERLREAVAVLSVVSEPAGAEVQLDGRDAGRTPLSLSDLDPGPRRLAVRVAGRLPWAAQVLLEPGSATRVEVSLAPARSQRPRRLRWIGYGGGGAMLVAGAALGGVALADRSAFFASENPTRAMLERVRAESIAADVLIWTGAAALGVTLILDLVLRRARESTGTVTIDR
jgi:hypothetical protein